MQDVQLLLIFALATVVTVLLSWLVIFLVVRGKNRVLQEQRRFLEAELRLRRAQEAFTDNAHHELKTPLQILSGHLYMLRLHDPSPDQEKLLSHAESATRRLQSLVQDLLDFTAIQQGSLRIRPELMDLESHMKELIADYQRQATTKGLAFQVESEPLAIPLACDGPRLRRALAALLENAVRFTMVGSIQVRWTLRQEPGGCRLRFEVQDTGVGVPADWLRLLRPFEQEAAHPHRVQEGMGLGLPLAAGLLGAMGGQLGLVPGPSGTLAWAEVKFEEPKA